MMSLPYARRNDCASRWNSSSRPPPCSSGESASTLSVSTRARRLWSTVAAICLARRVPASSAAARILRTLSKASQIASASDGSMHSQINRFR
jgi:hypothetical protein